jgi:uncharacterized protein YdiU (UPF0061 family)
MTSSQEQTTLDAALTHEFADTLPELALDWRAEDVPGPRLVALSTGVAEDLGLDPEQLRTPAGLGLLTGTVLPADARPVAQGYAGHQFGGYSPRLGDGRALLLGELTDRGGRLRDLHLKGSGRTPFSRGGDGRAAVGPMLREFVISEAMHALGIPTTRSLAVVATGRGVHRETGILPGAVLARVAASHLRVGSFQYARALGVETGDHELLRRLANHAIARHHPHAAEAEAPYVALFDAVAAAQARLVASWMQVGFVHGVLNTDNVTISGESIDYGPCAFLDAHHPSIAFSSIDTEGRYAYGNQPAITSWNLARLAEAMLPLFDEDQDRAIAIAHESLRGFAETYADAMTAGMSAKLGLPNGLTADVVRPLLEELEGLMSASRVDHTSFFRALGRLAAGDREPARGVVLDLPSFDAWTERWLTLGPDAGAMDRVNPVYVPRNHLVEEALDAATDGDLAPIQRLLEVVRRPYDERPGFEQYAAPAPDGLGEYVTFCGT